MNYQPIKDESGLTTLPAVRCSTCKTFALIPCEKGDEGARPDPRTHYGMFGKHVRCAVCLLNGRVEQLQTNQADLEKRIDDDFKQFVRVVEQRDEANDDREWVLREAFRLMRYIELHRRDESKLDIQVDNFYQQWADAYEELWKVKGELETAHATLADFTNIAREQKAEMEKLRGQVHNREKHIWDTMPVQGRHEILEWAERDGVEPGATPIERIRAAIAHNLGERKEP